MLSFNSNLSEMKSTIGTSSLSSELTIVSFTDITVSSQESFDNDNIALPMKTYPRISKFSLIFLAFKFQSFKRCFFKKVKKTLYGY